MNRTALSIGIGLSVLTAAAGAEGILPGVGGSSRELLSVDEAFHLVAAEREGDTLKVSWDIAPGYYLYRKRLGFRAVAPAGAALDKPQLPQGQTVHDEYQGDAEIYRGSLQASLHWPKGGAAPRQLQVSYQGCAEAGVCYPPQTRLLDVVDLSR
jgi:thioredoxin:protein disulfide reductase